jgi:uncharacterized protein
MNFERILGKKLLTMAQTMRAVAVIGPRQSGKTTLCKMTFPEKPYVSLENPVMRRLANEDPLLFLNQYKDGAIIDEIQRVPELFSWLQELIDEKPEVAGRFILSGSNQFQLLEQITQSLAGRLGILELMPFSLEEIATTSDFDKLDVHRWIWQGGYPRILLYGEDHGDWFAGYVRTYVERDVRLVRNIQNLDTFSKLIQLLAARVGSVLNVQSLSIDLGVNRKTIEDWLSVLQAGYIIWLLQPYAENFSKRVTKSPKIYFYDTGLASWLLDISSPEQLAINAYRGALFENAVLNEVLKYRLHRGLRKNLFFWQDNNLREIDLIYRKGDRGIPYEIKAGMTPQSDFFKNLKRFAAFSKETTGEVIYAGDQTLPHTSGYLWRSWKDLARPSWLGE